MYEIISTGSNGNAVIYHETILVDCGVPFTAIKHKIHDISLIILTHAHGDHINKQTVKKICFERPSMRVGCCEWMVEHLDFVKNLDVYKIGSVYNYGKFKISPFKLYHDIPNIGLRIFKGEIKIFHATDTSHLKGISAKDYDLYAIEHNYNEDTVHESIARIEANGGFAHQKGSINSHLSDQQAQDFFINNKCDKSKLIRLHESSFKG